MKRKSLVVKNKAKIEKLTSKNLKLAKFYMKFKSVLFNQIGNENFAIGVSGGADSLCLAYFSKMYVKEFKNKMHSLIVNHKLRAESTKEASKVKKMLKEKGISSVVLNWEGNIPEKNIQKNARNIRYSLLADYCLKKKIKYIVVGHHMDDQIENFFIRLFRGSGLKGLSSMVESFDYNKKLKIIRPFLRFKKKDLENITLNYFKNYINDPSNENEKYLRVRVRKYRKIMEKEGFDTNKIINTVNNLISANKALNFYKNKSLYKHVSFISKNKCLINKQIFVEEAGEVIFKSFSDILSLVSGTYYPPRSKKIMSLIERLKNKKFKRSTLGGCLIEKKEGSILVSREEKVKKMSFQLVK